eukprot:TRINITY_DN10651_c0_g1_i1.p1 TRINITY_DN10651_c0_g1~~TRINITY_DN10651_c0_g1_i1.p1  ORF type:complete len:928 (-),score=191.17 TRINITY_DN10651_c0_g1_i1:25-2808(-)
MGQKQSLVSLKPVSDETSTPFFGPLLRFAEHDIANSTWNVTALFFAQVDEPPTLDTILPFKGPALVDRYENWSFWRFNIAFPMADMQALYRLSAKIGDFAREFSCTVPARNQAPTIMYFSCNRGNEYHKKPLLWPKMLEQHQHDPYHLILGGGDQVYCDRVFEQCPTLARWSKLSRAERVREDAWTLEMAKEVEHYYMNHCIRSFSELLNPPFAQAIANVPYLFQVDDHDIFDGYGSYPAVFQNCAVFDGIRFVAKRAYFLFQQHQLQNEDMFGGEGRSFLKTAGPYAILGVDARFERSRDQIVAPSSWKQIYDKLYDMPDTVTHVLALLSVPVIYPSYEFVERALQWMAPTGIGQRPSFGSCVGKMCGPVLDQAASPSGDPDLLDDVIDQWRSPHHRAERLGMLQNLQHIAKTKHVRVTILTGDVHCCGFGALYHVDPEPYSDMPIDPATDPAWIGQIISSSIGSESAPPRLVSFLSKQGKKMECFDERTRGRLFEMKPVSVGNDKPGQLLFPRRNFTRLRQDATSGDLSAEIFMETRHTARDHTVKVYSAFLPAPPGYSATRYAGLLGSLAAAPLAQKPAQPLTETLEPSEFASALTPLSPAIVAHAQRAREREARALGGGAGVPQAREQDRDTATARSDDSSLRILPNDLALQEPLLANSRSGSPVANVDELPPAPLPAALRHHDEAAEQLVAAAFGGAAATQDEGDQVPHATTVDQNLSDHVPAHARELKVGDRAGEEEIVPWTPRTAASFENGDLLQENYVRGNSSAASPRSVGPPGSARMESIIERPTIQLPSAVPGTVNVPMPSPSGEIRLVSVFSPRPDPLPARHWSQLPRVQSLLSGDEHGNAPKAVNDRAAIPDLGFRFDQQRGAPPPPPLREEPKREEIAPDVVFGLPDEAVPDLGFHFGGVTEDDAGSTAGGGRG